MDDRCLTSFRHSQLWAVLTCSGIWRCLARYCLLQLGQEWEWGLLACGSQKSGQLSQRITYPTCRGAKVLQVWLTLALCSVLFAGLLLNPSLLTILKPHIPRFPSKVEVSRFPTSQRATPPLCGAWHLSGSRDA